MNDQKENDKQKDHNPQDGELSSVELEKEIAQKLANQAAQDHITDHPDKLEKLSGWSMVKRLAHNYWSIMFNKLFKKSTSSGVGVINLLGVVTPDVVFDYKSNSFTGISGDLVRDCLSEAEDIAAQLKLLILKIDSPGGSPTEAEKIATGIRRFREKTHLPVVAFIEGMGASAAYWIAASCDAIFCYQSSAVGSIGVILDGSFGFEKVMKKYGISRRLYTAGKKKAMLDPFSDVTNEHKKHVKGVLDSLHKTFIDHVKDYRQDFLKKGKHDEIFSGAWFNGTEALELGLVDGLIDMSDYLENLFHKNYHILEISPEVPKRGLFNITIGKAIDYFTSSLAHVFENSLAKMLNGHPNIR